MAPRTKNKLVTVDPSQLGYTSGFLAYPVHRDLHLIDGLCGRAALEGAEGLWRVHDRLYDLSEFASRHPGGRWWISATRGLDITELFESSHVFDRAEKLLGKYYVRDANQPRNSPFTFREDGFYRTLKRRVAAQLLADGGSTGPTWRIHALMDSLVVASVLSGVLAAAHGSLLLAVLSGVVLHTVPACAHNYHHQRDSARMRLSSMAPSMTVAELRALHVLAHHPFPNTVYDPEVYLMQPLFRLLAERDKRWWRRHLNPVLVVLIGLTGGMMLPLVRPLALLVGRIRPSSTQDWLELILIYLWLPLYYVASGGDLAVTLTTYCTVMTTSLFCLWIVMLTSTHHHPDDFHDGDAARADRDWGLHQLDATNERSEFVGNFVLTAISYGDHALHHLFPTVDVSRLYALYPLLRQTCREFDVALRMYPQLEMLTAPLRQMARCVPHEGPERHRWRPEHWPDLG